MHIQQYKCFECMYECEPIDVFFITDFFLHKCLQYIIYLFYMFHNLTIYLKITNARNILIYLILLNTTLHLKFTCVRLQDIKKAHLFSCQLYCSMNWHTIAWPSSSRAPTTFQTESKSYNLQNEDKITK